ncbi:MAG: hypothetical protein ABIU05_09645 [Nitrospirales bacterium]
MHTAEQMNVILVRPNRFNLNQKPFLNLGSRLLDNRRTASSSSAFLYFTEETMW